MMAIKMRPMPGGETLRNGPLYRRAVENIERLILDLDEARRERGGFQQKELASAIGMSDSVLSQKLRGNRSHFFEDEMEAIAVFFRKETGRPLIGFPHLSWDTQEIVDRRVAGWKP